MVPPGSSHHQHRSGPAHLHPAPEAVALPALHSTHHQHLQLTSPFASACTPPAPHLHPSCTSTAPHPCNAPCARAGREVREQMFEQVTALLHDLDEGMVPLSVMFPYAPIKVHRVRDK
jgi:hypothetical protein